MADATGWGGNSAGDKGGTTCNANAPGWPDSAPLLQAIELLGDKFNTLEQQHNEYAQTYESLLDSKLFALQTQILKNLELGLERVPEPRDFLAATHGLEEQLAERFTSLERRHQDCFHTLVVKLDRSQDMLRDKGKKDKVQWSCPVPVPGGAQVLREAFPQTKKIVDLFSDGALQDDGEVRLSQEYRQEHGKFIRQNAKDLHCSRV